MDRRGGTVQPFNEPRPARGSTGRVPVRAGSGRGEGGPIRMGSGRFGGKGRCLATESRNAGGAFKDAAFTFPAGSLPNR